MAGGTMQQLGIWKQTYLTYSTTFDIDRIMYILHKFLAPASALTAPWHLETSHAALAQPFSENS